MRKSLALLVLALGSAAASGALAQSARDSELQEVRQTLHRGRLMMADRLRSQGDLSAADRNLVESATDDAMMLWHSCVTSKLEHIPKTVDAEVGADEVIAACAGDRDEFGAWFRFTSEANHEELPTDQWMSDFLAKLEARNRSEVVKRLRKRR